MNTAIGKVGSEMRGTNARSDAGAAAVLAVAIVGAIAALTATVLPLYIGMGIRQSVIAAADASALGAADVASGRMPGVPCAIAEQIAGANHARIDRCEADGLILTVVAERTFLGIRLRATAAAGPP